VDHDSSQSQHGLDGADHSDAALDCWSAVLILVQLFFGHLTDLYVLKHQSVKFSAIQARRKT
jgi:cytochrome bd-type quinol oxidase subunit 1